jgi:hypothetical protein
MNLFRQKGGLSMRRLLLVLVLILSFEVLAEARTWPQLALGGGYRAVILISNKKNTDWTGQFFPKQGHEQVWAGTWRFNGQDYTGQSSFNIAVPAYTTTKVVLTGDDAVPVQTGYLFMWGTGTSSAYDVSIAYFYEYYQGGQLMMSNGSIEGAPHTTFYVPLEYSTTASGTVNTGIAWAPEISTTSPQFNIKATLYLTDVSGTRSYTKTIPYSGHAALFITEIFPEVAVTSFKGFLELQADNNVFLEVLRLDTTESGFLLTSTPPDFTTP